MIVFHLHYYHTLGSLVFLVGLADAVGATVAEAGAVAVTGGGRGWRVTGAGAAGRTTRAGAGGGLLP